MLIYPIWLRLPININLFNDLFELHNLLIILVIHVRYMSCSWGYLIIRIKRLIIWLFNLYKRYRILIYMILYLNIQYMNPLKSVNFIMCAVISQMSIYK